MIDLVRRFGVAAAGIAAVGAVCLGCSSSTGGTPNPGSDELSLPSISIPAISDLPSISGIPSIGIPSISGLPSIGGDQADSAFCKDVKGQNFGVTPDAGTSAAFLDKLASDAPDEIKSDVQTYADYVKGALSGRIDPTEATKVAPAIQSMVAYIAAHCAG